MHSTASNIRLLQNTVKTTTTPFFQAKPHPRYTMVTPWPHPGHIIITPGALPVAAVPPAGLLLQAAAAAGPELQHVWGLLPASCVCVIGTAAAPVDPRSSCLHSTQQVRQSGHSVTYSTAQHCPAQPSTAHQVRQASHLQARCVGVWNHLYRTAWLQLLPALECSSATAMFLAGSTSSPIPSPFLLDIDNGEPVAP